MPAGIPNKPNPPFNTKLVAVFIPYETPIDILVKLSQRKMCVQCKIVFPLICFTKDNKQKDRHARFCKNCADKISKENYEKNIIIRRAQNLRNYHKNKPNTKIAKNDEKGGN